MTVTESDVRADFDTIADSSDIERSINWAEMLANIRINKDDWPEQTNPDPDKRFEEIVRLLAQHKVASTVDIQEVSGDLGEASVDYVHEPGEDGLELTTFGKAAVELADPQQLKRDEDVDDDFRPTASVDILDGT